LKPLSSAASASATPRKLSILAAFAIAYFALFPVIFNCQDGPVVYHEIFQPLVRKARETFTKAFATCFLSAILSASAMIWAVPAHAARYAGRPPSASAIPLVRFKIAGVRGRDGAIAQDDDNNQTDIPPESIAKYVAVYRDMQRDRTLTVKQAAAKEGMPMAQFRNLEGQIERDESARQQVRDELQAAAKNASPAAAQSPSPK
jgi:hypothetical protein